jgi:signal transduction histidine kinase
VLRERRRGVDPVHMTSVAAAPSGSVSPAPSTSLRDALVAIGVLMTALVLVDQAVPSRSRGSVAAIVEVASVAAFTVTGLVAWHRRPHNATGRLMVAAALALWAAALQDDDIEALRAVGLFLDSLPLAVLLHLLLAFPSGRISDRTSRITAVAAYVVALAPPVIQRLVTSTDAVVLVGSAQTVLGLATMVAAFVLALRRLSTAPAVIRRQLLPFLGYGCFAVAVIAIGIGVNHSDASNTVLDTVLLLQLAMIFGLPMAFVLAMTVGAFGRAGEVEEVARGISEASAEPRLLDDLMVRALGDGSARVLWTVEPGRDHMVDSDGAPREIAPDQGWWPIGVERPPLGGLQYDRSLVADTSLVATVAAPLELALDNRRLVVELRSAVQRLDAAAAELRTSRRRIVVAADAERRRIARDLHDGAQQRILLIGIEVQRLSRRAEDVELVRSVAARVGEQCRSLVEDLRLLVQGIMPATLQDRGLEAAVAALAEQMPIPVRVDVVGTLDRMDAEVESTGYFVVAEALANAVKHAEASAVAVTLSVRDGRLEVEVTDDGRGPADAAPGFGLRSLGDRVAALDGMLSLQPAVGRGSTLRAEFVCA